MKMTFPTKGYGRIFCKNMNDITKVKEIIKEIDEYEYQYLPEDLITIFPIPKEENGEKSIYLKAVYTHKFNDLDLNELQARCFIKGIPIFCYIVSSSYNYNDEFYCDMYITL